MLRRKLLRDLAARRVRTALTVAGILVGVAGLVAIISSARGFERAQRAAFASGDRADLSLFLFDAPATLLRAVERLPDVEAADLRVNHYGRGRLGAEGPVIELQFLGLRSLAAQPVERLALLSGTLPGPDEALIEPSAAASHGLAIGDPITFVDRNGRERPLRLSGIARLPSMLSSDLRGIPLLFVSDRTTREMQEEAGYNELVVKLASGAARPDVRDALSDLLTRRAISRGEFRFADPTNYPGKRELDALFLILYLFSGLGLVLSAFLVANTLAASVTESTREIGILKSIGATRRQVLRSYLAAAALYGAIGTLLGMAVGTVGGFVLLRLLGGVSSLALPFRAEPEALAAGALVGLVVPILGGAIPAWQAASLSAKQALDSRGITSDFGRSRLDRLAQRLTRGSAPLAAMAPRNLLRRRGRSAVTLVVVALAVGALLAAQATDRSVALAIQGIFGTYRADGYLRTDQPLLASQAGTLRRVPGITHAEPWLQRPCSAGLIATRCWAMAADGELYRPNLVEGQWLDPADPRAVVLTDDLARDAGLRVGDSFTLRYREREQRVTVRGVVRDNALFLGSTITSKLFAPLPTMAALAQTDGADFFAVKMAPTTLDGQRAVMDELGRRLASLQPSGTLALAEYESTRELTSILTTALRAMVLLVALSGAAGLLNTLALGVLERRREIGVLRALGSDARQIGALFVAEGLALGLLGGLAGLALGALMAFGFVRALSTALFALPLSLPPSLAIGALAFALLLALLASLLPALAAARLAPVEALRYE